MFWLWTAIGWLTTSYTRLTMATHHQHHYS